MMQIQPFIINNRLMDDTKNKQITSFKANNNNNNNNKKVNHSSTKKLLSPSKKSNITQAKIQ